jgi:CHAD domain-containing protein
LLGNEDSMTTWLAPDLSHPHDVGPIAGGSGRLQLADERRVRVLFLDTFDWRVHRAGHVLAWEAGAGSKRLVLQPLEDNTGVTAAPAGATAPAWPDELPEGHLRRVVAPVLGPRRLLPLGDAEVERLSGSLQDGNGNLILSLVWERWIPRDSDGSPTDPSPWTLRVRGPLPRHPAVDRAMDTLQEHPELQADDFTPLAFCCGARGRHPRDYSSKIALHLDPDQAAETAVRHILLHLEDTIRRNVPGTIADLDVEFLHDLRVATRRSRSAISLLKAALPMADIAPFRGELKWLGAITGPCRDLDVWLMDMDAMRARLPTASAVALDPFERLLAAERRTAQRTLARQLRGARFHALLKDWRELLERPAAARSAGEAANRPIRLFARARILKVYRRIIRAGRALGDDPPAAPLHQLRIEAKKLRYLLEFFAGLDAEGRAAGLIKKLKTIQDVLGGFNDMEVQQQGLRSFSARLLAQGAPDPETLLALGRLDGIMAAQQETHRQTWCERFRTFDRDDVDLDFRNLLGGNK